MVTPPLKPEPDGPPAPVRFSDERQPPYMHVVSSLRSPVVWIHTRGGKFYPRVTGERVVRLNEITVMKLWEAMVRAERRRFEGIALPKLVAEELALESTIRFPPDEAASPGRFHAVVERIRGMRCPGNPRECLVALLMEALAHREGAGNLAVVGCSWKPDGTCEVALGPKVALGKFGPGASERTGP